MIKLENIETYGWEAAIRGMRNPMNSWDKSDSVILPTENIIDVGKNDLALMKKLAAAGTDHRTFMRMINVTMDITAPLYWWKEFDTYKVGTVRDSCSTMHKIAAKEFTLDDFSHEHVLDPDGLLSDIVTDLNSWRREYLSSNDKAYWHQLIQLLPSSYNQRATVQLNYEVLANMYKSRKNHKLDEWQEFCKEIEKFPYVMDIIGGIQ